MLEDRLAHDISANLRAFYRLALRLGRGEIVSYFHVPVLPHRRHGSKAFENEEYQPTYLPACLHRSDCLVFVWSSVSGPRSGSVWGHCAELAKRTGAGSGEPRANVSAAVWRSGYGRALSSADAQAWPWGGRWQASLCGFALRGMVRCGGALVAMGNVQVQCAEPRARRRPARSLERTERPVAALVEGVVGVCMRSRGVYVETRVRHMAGVGAAREAWGEGAGGQCGGEVQRRKYDASGGVWMMCGRCRLAGSRGTSSLIRTQAARPRATSPFPARTQTRLSFADLHPSSESDRRFPSRFLDAADAVGAPIAGACTAYARRGRRAWEARASARVGVREYSWPSTCGRMSRWVRAGVEATVRWLSGPASTGARCGGAVRVPWDSTPRRALRESRRLPARVRVWAGCSSDPAEGLRRGVDSRMCAPLAGDDAWQIAQES
ncbi:hypothetical protein C8R45DRAFT_941120 [Mycena sanguinolenta]|nr:hypothetical protein C8R45DRAFT_941120 [Mycena sanguinolenta]